MRENSNHIEVDLKKSNTMVNLSENSFTSNPLDSARCDFSKEFNNKSYISNKISKSNSSFKLIIREDYSGYTNIKNNFSIF